VDRRSCRHHASEAGGGLDGIITPLANPNTAIRGHGPVRLNFGCGAYPLAGSVKVRSTPGALGARIINVPVQQT